nr:unnamed protein product [uncultured bacterium]
MNQLSELAKEMLLDQAKEIEQQMARCVELDLLDELKQYRQLFDNVMEQLRLLNE